MIRLPRIIYVVLRLLEALGSGISRTINGCTPGGSTSVSLSTRANIMADVSRLWATIRFIANWIYFFQKDHCEWSMLREEENSRNTLRKIEELRQRRERVKAVM